MSVPLAAAVLGIVFERPLALALVVLPLALLVLAGRRATRRSATGDLEPWRAARAGTGAPRTPRLERPPLALWLASGALLSGALAVAGARAAEPRARWTCVLDTTPSMALALDGATRRERARATALELAARAGADVSWTESDTGFDAWDAPGVLWVTDRVPEELPRFAGLVASGGEAVPGPVAVAGADRIDWDGERLVVASGAAPARCVVVLDVGEATPLGRVLAAWAAARGLGRAEQPAAPCAALVLSGPRSAATGTVRAGRDGWSASGELHGAVQLEGATGLVPWIAHEELVLVAATTGHVATAWLPGEPDDPAAFAVSWARLLDAHVRPPPGVVPLDERRAAGAAVAFPPRAQTAPGARRADALLGALAAALALAAILARR
ncbi:MAG: hypothetical protein JNK02_12865 [Planctomycetes bacterium]|nr:hypothetical protein [Planctomycetota bacterium]